MDRSEFRRLVGDTIQVVFNPTGSLCKATLSVGDETLDVTQQLPGANTSNAQGYLARLGFKAWWDESVISLARRVQECLEGTDLYVADFHRLSGEVLRMVVRDRRKELCGSQVAVFLVTTNGRPEPLLAWTKDENIRSFLQERFAEL